MISAAGAPELVAAIRQLKAVDREVRRAVGDESTPRIAALWQRGVSGHTRSTVDRLVFADAKVVRGNPPVLVAGGAARRLPGGARASELARPREFGSGRRDGYHRYTGRNRHGKSYPVRRRTQRQLPARTPTGRVVYPAVAGVVPAAVAIWCDAITRAVAAAAFGEQTTGGA